MKSREPQLLTICLQLKLPSSDGKYYNTDCVNTENAFRLIQSIPSKKAEPFKRWLAKVGYERVQEIEDPELAQKRMKEIVKFEGLMFSHPSGYYRKCLYSLETLF